VADVIPDEVLVDLRRSTEEAWHGAFGALMSLLQRASR